MTAEMTCSGCGCPRPANEVVSFRPDGFGLTFGLCRRCRRAVAASEDVAALTRAEQAERERDEARAEVASATRALDAYLADGERGEWESAKGAPCA